MLVDGGSTAQLMNASGLFRGKMYENARADLANVTEVSTFYYTGSFSKSDK